MASASFTVLSGKPLLEDLDDNALAAITSKGDLTYYINAGMFGPHHLRVYASMPKGSVRVLRQIANIPGTKPAAAVDYCISGVFAEILLEIGNAHDKPQEFEFYSNSDFTQRRRSISDNRHGADAFRNSHVVYEVASERILFGGNVLPGHFVQWYNARGKHGHHARYMNNRKRDGARLRKCYSEYETQTAARTVDDAIIVRSTYDFMVAYHIYTKYFPVFMYLLRQSNKVKKLEEIVVDMTEKKCSKEQIEAAVRGMQAMEIESANSSEQKKKQRKFNKLTSKDAKAKELVGAANFTGACCGLIKDLIISFLV